MKTFATGFLLGTLTVLAVLTLFGGLLYAPAKRELIENWRKIQPGMSTVEVESILGPPNYSFNSGERFPPWASENVPHDYWHGHGLIAYTINRPGPQILIIYTDDNQNVTFVSSVST